MFEFQIISAVKFIMERWLEEIKSKIPSAREHDDSFLIDHMPVFTEHVFRILDAKAGAQYYGTVLENAQTHGRQRSGSPWYRVSEVILEYTYLREIIFRHIKDQESSFPDAKFLMLTRLFEGAIGSATESFVSHSKAPGKSATHKDLSQVFLGYDEFLESHQEAFGEKSPGSILHDSDQSSEARFRSVFSHASVGFAVSALNGHLLEVNPRFCEITGYSEAELRQLSLNDLVYEEDRLREKELLSLLTSGTSRHQVIEKRFIRKDGDIVWVRNSISLDKGIDGEPLLIRVAEDVTDRKISDRLRRESEARFVTLANSMPQIVWTATPDGMLDYFNQVWFDYSGTDYEENRGEGWAKAVHPDDIPKTLETWKRSLLSGDIYENEFRLRSASGLYRWFVARAVPAFDAKGKITKWYGTNTDFHNAKVLSEQLVATTSELREAKEKAEIANAAKSAFLANMSHEIRTPLGAIMGFVNLLKDDTLERKEMDDYLGVIDRNSTQLLRIIDDILDLSKVEAGKMIIEHVNFSLLEILSDFSSLMGFRARENGIDFMVKAESRIPDPVNSDPTRIRQILNNVVGNAIKFTARGRVDLVVSYQEDVLTFKVKDTGRGISPEQARGLFQPFAQADESTTRKFGGTGLGLVLTKKLCEALGGDFWLEESELGKGSTFIARFRVDVADGSKMIGGSNFGFTTETFPSKSPMKSTLIGMKILVVDDSPDNRLLIRVLLTRHGAEVSLASDGFEGVESALGCAFDLILMDVQMPRMDGYEAVHELRKRGYENPIIALTAHAMQEERDKCLEAGYTEFMSKPINQVELIDTVKRFYT